MGRRAQSEWLARSSSNYRERYTRPSSRVKGAVPRSDQGQEDQLDVDRHMPEPGNIHPAALHSERKRRQGGVAGFLALNTDSDVSIRPCSAKLTKSRRTVNKPEQLIVGRGNPCSHL